jgi:DNA replication protein DnaC
VDKLRFERREERFGDGVAAQLLEHVADLEEQERARRSMERRLSRSRLGRFKPMADFDWNWPTSIERDRVEAALRLDFLEDARNIVLVSPQGLGKTMIAQNIAHRAQQTTWNHHSAGQISGGVN